MASSPGFLRLLNAASALADTEIWSREDCPTVDELRTFLYHNRSALEEARAAIAEPCWSTAETYLPCGLEWADRLGELRSLSRAFVARGLMAHADGDLSHAMRCGFDCLDLANSVRRGGLILSLQKSIEFER